MFRNGLLISTAMTAIALLLSGAPAGAYAQSDMHVADRDANARFLCTYGQFNVSFISGSLTSNSWQTYSARVAVPLTGRGQTVSKIIVMEAQSRFSRGFRFSAGIYANKNGLPGKLIAGGTGSASPSSSTCGQVTIPITPTTLQPNTKYWIEENAPSGVFMSTELYWYANPKEKRNAFVKTYARTCRSSSRCTSSSSPWTKQRGPGPWFKLR